MARFFLTKMAETRLLRSVSNHVANTLLNSLVSALNHFNFSPLKTEIAEPFAIKIEAGSAFDKNPNRSP
jgi:hypothetical protein